MTKREMRKQIEDLTERLTYLENMHASVEYYYECPWDNSATSSWRHEYVYENQQASYDGRQLTRSEVREIVGNPHPRTREYTANTNKITDITLQELAKFVIDKVPIKRAYYKSDRYEVSHDLDSITKTVKTGLGNIKITEGTD